MSSKALEAKLSRNVFGLKLWVLVCICLGIFIVLILAVMVMWVTFRKKSRRSTDEFIVSQVPVFSKEIKVDKANVECGMSSLQHRPGENGTRKMLGQLVKSKSSETDNVSQCSSVCHNDRGRSSCSGDEGSSGSAKKFYTPNTVLASPLIGLAEFSHLGWGHHFMLRDLEMATNHFSKDYVIGEGGYGIVYRGCLINGTEVAVKKIFNNLGQAEKEFSVEVEAIGNVRHKNLVRLLGYCMEGIHRMLVYEYVKNGNLEQWLHGSTHQNGNFSWELRMKVILGTAKALTYLHEAIEPKVVHRDIKSSNILIDDDFNAKLSDFGLAKLLGSEKSFVSTRVMGTFGYVAPEYANTGQLNERSDVYSFGVLLLETVTGRDPVDYNRPSDEVNLVEWLKHMVGIKKVEEVVDPKINIKPSTRALKRALLIALKCIDPDSDKRPKMSRVVQMLEAEDDPQIEARRKRRSQTASMEIEPLIDSSNSAAAENKQTAQSQDSNSHPQ